MLELKRYQRRCIEELERYLQAARKSGNPKTAFIEQTEKPYTNLHGDPKAPFVCTRVPTGGGKTLIAAHAVASAFGHYLLEREETGLVLWLVPSDSIRTQTLAQLRDRNHPYREVLDHAFKGRVKVLDIVEARNIKPSDIAENICIIVTTLASIRREDTEGLKVYQQSGSLMEHFREVEGGDLFTDETELVIQSLANVIRLHRPLVVLDEGHNAQTALSVDVIRNFLPSCIVEYTATPLGGSNILIEVPAVELKQEEMVKIPIHLTNITQWQEAVREAKGKRDELEVVMQKEKKQTKEAIRPILLLQAEREQEHPEKVHVHRLVEFLIGELDVKREEIAIKTGKEDELKPHGLLDPKCPIRYIVTCAALKEGWDCSFAYVLCSVSNLGTRLGVEQLIGRILRLPNAKKKHEEELNHSYVYTSSSRFDDAAQAVVQGLQQEGYDQSDVIRSDEERKRAEYEAVRAVSDDEFSLPLLAIDGQSIDFYDLIPQEFSLRRKKGSVELLQNLENWTSLIDVSENAVIAGKQQKLRLLHLSEEETEERLILWLSRAIREQAVNKSEMVAFIRKLLKALKETHSLQVLYSQKFTLRDAITVLIKKILCEEAEQLFKKLHTDKKITSSKEQWPIPHTMTLLRPVREKWERHLFDRCDDLNNEELELARQLDSHPKAAWWLRNAVQDTTGFHLQGYHQWRFYPDFIVRTASDEWHVLEYKGEDRASNEDTQYKEHIGTVWAETCGNGFSFAIVTKENMGSVLSHL